MKKKSFKPILIDLKVLFGRSIKQLENDCTNLIPAVSNWGNDRVVSLQQNDTPVKTQFGISCTTFALIAAIENIFQGRFDLSERSLWATYKTVDIDKAIKAARENYILEEKYWPQSVARENPANRGKGRFKLEDAICIYQNYQEVINTIDKGTPCVVAMRTPTDLFLKKSQVERTSTFKNGGHAMAVVGYKVENGKGYFLVKNSWGEDCGDKGYQYVDFNLFDTNKQGYVYFYTIGQVIDRGILNII